MNRNVRKRTFEIVCPAKIQMNLHFRTVWSESSFSALRIPKDAKFLLADNEDSDQTARMRSLIRVCVGRKCHMVHFLTLRLIELVQCSKGNRTHYHTCPRMWTSPILLPVDASKTCCDIWSKYALFPQACLPQYQGKFSFMCTVAPKYPK